jgi:hypothetical protein
MRAGLRKLGLFMALVLLVLTLAPAVVLACPPILRSVTVEPGSKHPTAVWGLPANVTSQFMQTSDSAEVSLSGYFRHVESFNTFGPDQTTFTDPFDFVPGVYYLHIAGHDKRCNGLTCPSIEFSDIMTFEVAPQVAAASFGYRGATFGYRAARTSGLTCSGTPGGGTLPSTTGGPGPDRIAPIMSLSFKPVQDIDKLFVTARMSEAGTLKARATVRVGGRSKPYRFKTVSKSVAANVFAKLRLRLDKKKLKAVRRALKKGERLNAKITVTAVDKAHNKRSQKATIRLKK